jgi:hypothetical protein
VTDHGYGDEADCICGRNFLTVRGLREHLTKQRRVVDPTPAPAIPDEAALDLDALEQVAQAATLYPNREEGGWIRDPDTPLLILAPKQSNGWDGIGIADVRKDADAEFIATFDPPTVLALIDAARIARQEAHRG